MNSLPIFALGLIATGYASAIAGIDEAIDARAAAYPPQLAVLPAPPRDHLSIHDMPGLADVTSSVDDPHCELKGQMTAALDHDFAEKLVATRVVANGLQMDLYASTLMGTWTLIHNGADGISCIVNTGTGWTAEATAAQVFSKVDLAS